MQVWWLKTNSQDNLINCLIMSKTIEAEVKHDGFPSFNAASQAESQLMNQSQPPKLNR
jgi:hypothetical protein